MLIGKHLTVVLFDSPNEEALLKITHPARNFGIPHVCPALPMKEALKMMDKMRIALRYCGAWNPLREGLILYFFN